MRNTQYASHKESTVILGSRQTYAVVALDGSFRGTQGARDGAGAEGSEPAEAAASEGLLLHYRVPAYLEGHVEPGHLVTVPLRGRPNYGVVVGLSDASPVWSTQPITQLVDSRKVVLPHMLELARWISAHYHCTLWQALAPMLPPGVARRALTTLGLSSEAAAPESEGGPLIAALGRRQQQVVSLLRSAPRSTLTLSRLKRRYPGPPSGLSA